MIDPIVRRATVADVAALIELEAEARDAVSDQRGGRRWLDEHPELGAEAWPGTVIAGASIVATIDDVVVGYLVDDLCPDDRILRIEQVWVTPEARELGFGDAMLELAIAEARQLDAVGVEGEALPGDRHTKNLYERAGIVARLITTYKPL